MHSTNKNRIKIHLLSTDGSANLMTVIDMSDEFITFAQSKNAAMIKSMTGYGKAEALLDSGKLTVEIRTLNGKNAEINIKSSLLPREKEIHVRQKIAETLQRGTIDVFISRENPTSESAKKINAGLALDYYRQIEALCAQAGSPVPGIHAALDTLMKMPDVVDTSRSEIITEESWPAVEEAFDRCLEAVNDFRSREGETLYRDVTSRVATIDGLDREIEQYESERTANVRERILKAAEDLKIRLDAERFEQEMIFYLEKMDINEEKVRLRQHCRYFMDTIDSEPCPGKKLGFIIQEMGREINTTGSKANHAGIQKLVVRMKDELEKIREQSMNIL